ncbi:hypothetical protein ONS95_006178 [Cadophora gregata]|uniref:uncharacterized protein n=1 Tax=Cadophora gregata TaxID=51156 RepID=UPI0026DCA1EC|nr:uncharacterized protein ONS95_006178 [Cadophora gregata]KAK0102567.1 hypothetical protein ONS95_006178 [Cadophora gregata]
MVRTRGENPRGIQSPLTSIGNQHVCRSRPTPSPPRGAAYPPGMQFFYDEYVGLYDDDVSTLDLEGSVRSPSSSGVRAAIRSPSVASDVMVYIGDDGEEGDDESQFSEPAVETRLSDDEEDEGNAIVISDDDRTIISISSKSESESSDDDISDLDLTAGDNDDEDDDEDEDDNRTSPVPFSISSSPSTNHTKSPNRTIAASPPHRNVSPDHTISVPPSPSQSISNPPSPDRTISVPSTPNNQEDGPAADRDQKESPSPLRLPRDTYQDDKDEDMSDDGIVDFQGPDLPPYVNQAPSHFVRAYRGTTTIWSVVEWERDGPAILAEEAAEREKERLRRRRRANNSGQSRLARQRAWRQRQREGPRARVNGRFA